MNKQPNILVVDDEEGTCDSLYYILKDEGYEITTKKSGEEALKSMQYVDFDIVLTDIRMENMDGIQLLDNIKSSSPKTEVILITASPSLETSLPAARKGAFSYITKPINVEQLNHTIKKALEWRELVKENEALKKQIELMKKKPI